jgi:nicotinate-nucleotide adenylyltransferase
MEVAILGGTFNPVHLGHLYLADEVRLTLGYEKIIFVPDNLPAHKNFEEDVTADHRIEMLRIALGLSSHFEIDTCEIERGGISYTIETVRLISQKYNVREKIGVIIGDDLIDGFAKWKDADRLSKETTLIVAHRNYVQRKPFQYPHLYIDNVLLPISSSEIRERIRSENSVQFFLPEAVWQYINKNRLYRRGSGTSYETKRKDG